MVDVGKQLLRVAVQKKNRELIRLLVQCGADVTPSCYSIQAKLWLPPHPCVVEELVSLCSGASGERFYGRSLLEYLLNNYHIITYKFPKEKFLDKVKSIVKNGVSLETLNKYDHTPLMRSVIIRNLPQLTRIFLEAGADVNRQNNEGKTALHFAAESGSVKLVNVLLEFNANVNLQCSLGRTPLSTAVVNDDDKIICCLLANGADVNTEDHEGNTPLLISCRSIKKNVDVLKLLVKAGSDVDHQNNDGRTALMLAAELQDFDMVHTLCLSGADVNVVNLTRNETALSILFSSPKLDESQDLKCIDCLIQYGSKNLCLVPTHIHKCILYNRVSYIKQLILYGVGPEDVEIQHNNANSASYLVHVSPIQLALMHGNSNIAQIFQQMWFFTKSDIHILMNNNSKLREILNAKGYLPCIEFLDIIKRQPLSLQELSFLTVSQAVGSDIGRKQRVRQLGFPQVVQNKLMFEEVGDFTFGDDS
ncbi:putative ankyrin repeat protein RF_0381 [Physella acuta]|uniref:putative ankyrin repeat protein RF_0381 n=1 Tax=Physella acuta TaxID=109671 RepID=UPI0027DACE1F|nr:putative ankyrin repeat protein RF_0381 [Physella acuta]